MNRGAFVKLAYGFLFILIDFRIMGIDVLPDFIGYILFALSFSALTSYSYYFRRGLYVNIPMLIFSFFSIYEKPGQTNGISIGPWGLLGIPITIGIIILSILVVYYLFQGITEMAKNKGVGHIADEAGNRWKQFLYLQVAFLLAFVLIFVPFLAIVYIIVMLIVSVVLTFAFMRFMRVCGEYL